MSSVVKTPTVKQKVKWANAAEKCRLRQQRAKQPLFAALNLASATAGASMMFFILYTEQIMPWVVFMAIPVVRMLGELRNEYLAVKDEKLKNYQPPTVTLADIFRILPGNYTPKK